MDVNDDEPEDVKRATSVEKEIKKGEEDDTFEGYPRIEKKKERWQHCAKPTAKKKATKAMAEGECCERKREKMAAREQSKLVKVMVFGKPCVLPKMDIIPRHCLSKKEYIDMLATPSPRCPPQCLKEAVLKKLKPVSPRIKELARPNRQRMLMTLQEGASRLKPEFIDNLIKALEGETCLTPEQAAKAFRDQKRKKIKRKREEPRKFGRTTRKAKKPGVTSGTTLDKDAVTCQYLIAERFVKSILDWKCPIPKEEYQDIARVIIKRLSYVLEYKPTDESDRKSQQMRFLADVISCWIAGVLFEVAEDQKMELEEVCERKRKEAAEDEEEDEDEEETDEDIKRRKKDKDDEEEDDDEEEEEEEDEDKEEEKLQKEKEEEEARLQKEEEEAKLQKEKEEEEAKLEEEKEEEARLQEEEEEARLQKEKEEEEARLQKEKEEEEARLQKEKEEEEARLQKEEEEARLQKEKEEEEARLQKEKEEEEARLQKEKEEEEARLQKEKEEEEARLQKEKEEEEARLQKEKEEEEARLQQEKEEEEARLQKEKEEEEARLQKEKEEEEARLQKEKEEEEEARLQKEKEEEEARLQKEKEEEEARLQKEKEDEEARLQKEAEEAKLQKEKEEEDAKLQKEKEEEEEARLQKEAEDKLKEETRRLEEEKKKLQTLLEQEVEKREKSILTIGDYGDLFDTDVPFVTFSKLIDVLYAMLETMPEAKGIDPVRDRIQRAIYDKIIALIEGEDPEALDEHLKDVLIVLAGKIASWLKNVLTESQIIFLDKYPAQVESVEIRDWTKWLANVSETATDWASWLRKIVEEAEGIREEGITRGDWHDWTKSVDIDALLWRRFHLQTIHQAHRNVTMMAQRQLVKTGTKTMDFEEKEIRNTNLQTVTS